MFLQAGSLDQSIVIQYPNASANVYGEKVESWTTLATCFAKVKPVMGGNEGRDGGQISSESVYEFHVRYSNAVSTSTVNETMRIVWRSTRYYIRSVHEVMRDKGLVLIAVKKDSWVSQT